MGRLPGLCVMWKGGGLCVMWKGEGCDVEVGRAVTALYKTKSLTTAGRIAYEVVDRRALVALVEP